MKYTISSRLLDCLSGADVFWVSNRSNDNLIITRMTANWIGSGGAKAEMIIRQGDTRPTSNHIDAFTQPWDQSEIPEKIDALRWQAGSGSGMEGAVNGQDLDNAILTDGSNDLGHVGYELNKGDSLGFICAPSGKLSVSIECERKD